MMVRCQKLLVKYRNTPCTVTDYSPSVAIISNKTRTLLDYFVKKKVHAKVARSKDVQ